MGEASRERVGKLQERINAALQEGPEDWARSDFSDFLPDHSAELEERLMRAAAGGGVRGVESALDEFDRLLRSEDRVRAQHALLIFLTHHPAVAGLGLRIPSLEERSPWKVAPGKKGPSGKSVG